MTHPETVFRDPASEAADYQDARERTYNATLAQLPDFWRDHALVGQALDGVTLEEHQGRQIAALRRMAKATSHPGILAGAIIEFCDGFGELIVDHVFENDLADPATSIK